MIEEERTQQAAQFGWFNDLYVYDTGNLITHSLLLYLCAPQKTGEHIVAGLSVSPYVLNLCYLKSDFKIISQK